MIRERLLYSNYEIKTRAKSKIDPTVEDLMVWPKPQEREHVRVALAQQERELPQLVCGAVPLSDLDVAASDFAQPGQAEVVLYRQHVDAAEVVVRKQMRCPKCAKVREKICHAETVKCGCGLKMTLYGNGLDVVLG